MGTRRYHIIRKWLIAILVGMSFMRLVWIQIRDFNIVVDEAAASSLSLYISNVEQNCPAAKVGDSSGIPLSIAGGKGEGGASVGLVSYFWLRCQVGPVDTGFLLKTNLFLFAMSVFFMVVAARLITSSWTVGFSVLAMLLSRGSMINGISFFSADSFLVFGLCAAFLSWIHFARTLFLPSFLFCAVNIFCLATFDIRILSFSILPILYLVLNLVFYRSKGEGNRAPFRKVESLSLKSFFSACPRKIVFASLLGTAIIFFLQFYLVPKLFNFAVDWSFQVNDASVRELVRLSSRTFDLHFKLSLVALLGIFIWKILKRDIFHILVIGFVLFFLATALMPFFASEMTPWLTPKFSESSLWIWAEAIVLTLPMSYAVQMITYRLRL